MILLILKVVLGIQLQVSGQDKSPTLGKEKLAKALGCLGGRREEGGGGLGMVTS